MSETPPCPACKSTFSYSTGVLLMCPECGHEWNPEETAAEEGPVVKDANGNVLQDGDHNTDCKVDGFGSMALKSEFVKKA